MKNKRKKIFGIIMVLVLGVAALAGVFAMPAAQEADAYNKLSSTISGYNSSTNTYNYVDYGEYPQTLIGEVKEEYIGNNAVDHSDIGLLSRLIDMYRVRTVYSAGTYPNPDPSRDWFTGRVNAFYGNSSSTSYTLELEGNSYSIGFDWSTRYYTLYSPIGSLPARTKIAAYNKMIDYVEKYESTANSYIYNYRDDVMVNDTSITTNGVSKSVSNDGKIYLFKVEPVRWKVLSRDGDYLTLMADKIIDASLWDNDDRSVTYNTSDIRQWLNPNYYPRQYARSSVDYTQYIENMTVTNVATNWTGNTSNGEAPGFYLNSDGFYESNISNVGAHSKYVICRVDFTVTETTDVGFYAYVSSESSCDTGVFSALDTQLSRDTSRDGIVDLYSRSNYHAVIYNSVPAGQHFIEVKYRKDSSVDTGRDSVQFTIPDDITDFGYIGPIEYNTPESNIPSYTSAHNRNNFMSRTFSSCTYRFCYVNGNNYKYYTTNMDYEFCDRVFLPSKVGEDGELSNTNGGSNGNGLLVGTNAKLKATDYAKIAGCPTDSVGYGKYWLGSYRTSSYGMIDWNGAIYNSGSAATIINGQLGIAPVCKIYFYGPDYLSYHNWSNTSTYYFAQDVDNLQPLAANASYPIRIGYEPSSPYTGTTYALYPYTSNTLSNIASSARIEATRQSTDSEGIVYKLDYSGFPKGGMIIAEFFVESTGNGYITPITTTVDASGTGTTYIKAQTNVGLFSSKRFFYLLSNRLYQINDGIIEEHSTVYVNPNASDDSGDGSSANPFKFFQTALDHVGNGGTIITTAALTRQNMLQIGYDSSNRPLYKGNTTNLYYNSSYTYNNQTKYYHRVNDRGINVTIQRNGGGTIFNLDNSSLYMLWLDNFIIDGQGFMSSEPLISCKYSTYNNYDSYHYLYFTDLTIKDYIGTGTNSALTIKWEGSSFSYYYTAPYITFHNCQFIDCSTKGNGGAVQIQESRAIYIGGCTFLRNHADGKGGALYVGEKFIDTVYIGYVNYTSATGNYKCTFEGNSADSDGGALYFNFHYRHNLLTPNMETLTTNSPNYNYDSTYASWNARVYMNYATFEGNASGGNGGAIYSNCGIYTLNGPSGIGYRVFRSNHATGNGGAVYITEGGYGSSDNNSSGDFSNAQYYGRRTLFDGNIADGGRGLAIYCKIDHHYGDLNNVYNYIWSCDFNNHTFSGTSSQKSEVVYVELNRYRNTSYKYYFQMLNCSFQKNISTDCAGLRVVYNAQNYDVRIAYSTFGSYYGDTREGGGINLANEGKCVLDITQSSSFAGNSLRFDSYNNYYYSDLDVWNSSNMSFCFNKVSEALVNLDFSNSTQNVSLTIPTGTYFSDNQKLHSGDTMKVLRVALGSDGSATLSSLDISNTTISDGYLVEITAGNNFNLTAGISGSGNYGADAIYHIVTGNNSTIYLMGYLHDNVVNDDVVYVDMAGKTGCTLKLGYDGSDSSRSLNFDKNIAGGNILNCVFGNNTTVLGGVYGTYGSGSWHGANYNMSTNGNILNYQLGENSTFAGNLSYYGGSGYRYNYASYNTASSASGKIINVVMGKNSTFADESYPAIISASNNVAGDCIFNLEIAGGGSTNPDVYMSSETLNYNMAGDCIQRINIPNGSYVTSSNSSVLFNILTNTDNHSLVHIVDAKVADFGRSQSQYISNSDPDKYKSYIGNSVNGYTMSSTTYASPKGLGKYAGGIYISKGSTDLELTAMLTRCTAALDSASDGASMIYVEDGQYVTFPNCYFYYGNNYLTPSVNINNGTITTAAGSQNYTYITLGNVTESYNVIPVSSFTSETRPIRFGTNGALVIDGCKFGYNNGTNGSALSFTSGTSITLTGCTFEYNTAAGLNGVKGNGGAIYSTIPVTLIDCIINSNSASGGQGGAIYCESDVTISNTLTQSRKSILYNSSSQGGAIYCAGDLSVTWATIYGNNTQSYSGVSCDGGAIYCLGDVTINKCLFSYYFVDYSNGSDINSSAGNGGTIFVKGDLSITDAYFGGSQSGLSGGAIYAWGDVELVGVGFYNCRVSSMASESCNGGAIYIRDGSKNFVYTDLSFYNCYAYRGGAIYYPTTKALSFTSNGSTNYSIYKPCLWDVAQNTISTTTGEYCIGMNKAQIGGFIYTCGSVSFSDMIIRSPFAYRGGDIAYIDVSGIADYNQTDKNIFVDMDNCLVYSSGTYSTSASNSSDSYDQGGIVAVNNTLLNSQNLGFTQSFNKCSFVSTSTARKNSSADGQTAAPIRVLNRGIATFTDCMFVCNSYNSYTSTDYRKGGFIYVGAGGSCTVTGTGSDYKHPSVVSGNGTSTNTTIKLYSPAGNSVSLSVTSRNNAEYGTFAYVANGATFDISGTTIGAYSYRPAVDQNYTIQTYHFYSYDTNGIIYSAPNATISVTSCTIASNAVYNSHVFEAMGDISYIDCLFEHNWRIDYYNVGGGVIFVKEGTITTIYNCTFDSNSNRTVLETYELTNKKYFGGSIYVEGRLIMMSSRITNSKASIGSAIYCANGSIVSLSDVEIDNCKFYNNRTGGYNGGTIYVESSASLSMTSCNMHDNSSYGGETSGGFKFYGGIAIHSYGQLSISSCSFINNGSTGAYSTNAFASAIYSSNPSSNLKLSKITVETPTDVWSHCALNLTHPSVEIYELDLVGHLSGGVVISASNSIVDSSHFDNSSLSVAMLSGAKIISNCTFNNNTSPSNTLVLGAKQIKNCQFNNNSAPQILNISMQSNIEISDCEFIGNTGTNSASYAMLGIRSYSLSMTRCVIEQNHDYYRLAYISDTIANETGNTRVVLEKVNFRDNYDCDHCLYYPTGVDSSMYLSDCSFVGNEVASYVFAIKTSSSIFVENSFYVSDNTISGTGDLINTWMPHGAISLCSYDSNGYVNSNIKFAVGADVHIINNRYLGVEGENNYRNVVYNSGGLNNNISLYLSGYLQEGSKIGTFVCSGDIYSTIVRPANSTSNLLQDYVEYFTSDNGYVVSLENNNIIVSDTSRIASEVVVIANDISYTVRNSDLTTTAYSVEPRDFIAYTNATYTGVEYYYGEEWHTEAPTYNAVNATGYTVSFRLVNGSEYIYADESETPFTFKLYIVPQSLHISVVPTVIVLFGASFSTAVFRDYQVVNDNGNAVAGYWDFTNSSDRTKTVNSSNMSNSYSVTFTPYNTDVYGESLSTSITLKVNYDKVYYRKNSGSNIGFYSTMTGSTKLSITTLSDMITYLNDYGKIVFSETYNVSTDTNIVANKVIYFVRSNAEMPIFTVASGKTLSMSGGVGRIIFDGLDVGAVQSGTHLIDNNGTTTLGNNIIIRNFVNNNAAESAYGVIYTSGSLTLDGVEICDCTNTFGNGGAIYSTGVLVINGGEFHKNKAEKGGFVYSTGEIMLSGGAIRLNEAKLGGGIYADGGAIYLSAGEVKFNKAVNTSAPTTTSGGGIYAENCSITIGSTKIYSNSAYADSGISSGEEVTIINVSGEVYSSAAYINSQNITIAEQTLSETKHSVLLLLAAYMSIALVVALTVLSKRPQKVSKKK